MEEEVVIDNTGDSYQKELSILDYEQLTRKIADSLKEIANKIYTGKQNSQNNTERGIFEDLEISVTEMENAYFNLLEYFKSPPSKDEKEIIGRIASMRKTIDVFSNFANEIQQISLDEKVKDYNEQIHRFCDIVEKKLSNNAEQYGIFLDNFVKDGKQKLNIFSNVFNKMIKNTKLLFVVMIIIVFATSAILGILAILSYLKFQEYSKLQTKINLITQGLATISAEENGKTITLSIAKNKKTILTEDKNSIKITLQGGE